MGMREHQHEKNLPIVLKWSERGLTSRAIAALLKKEYKVNLTHTTILNWLRREEATKSTVIRERGKAGDTHYIVSKGGRVIDGGNNLKRLQRLYPDAEFKGRAK